MSKITMMKLANSVKAGSEELFLDGRKFDMELVDHVKVLVRNKHSGEECYTTLFNVCWWKEEEAAEEKPAPIVKKAKPKA
jgi:hypothetical protein